MRNKFRIRILLLTFGLVLTIYCINNYTIFNFQGENDGITLNREGTDLKSPKSSGYWTPNFIHVDGNWSATTSYDWCSGDGSWNNPYIIENVTINAFGSPTGCGILIENSINDYFIIRNCTVFNSGTTILNAGIRMENTNNGILKNNTCSTDNCYGIHLVDNCYNHTILENIANDNSRGINIENGNMNILLINNTLSYNKYDGIRLYGDHCNVSNNYLKNNGQYGIVLSGHNNTIKGNQIYKGGLLLSHGNLENLNSHDVDATNLVNEKHLYWYSNRVNLGANDFIDAGQVILVNCTDSLITNLNVSYAGNGITLYYCNNNNVTNNIANYNSNEGIFIWGDYNIISGNTANNNYYGLSIHQGNNRVFENTVTHNDREGISFAGSYNSFLTNNVSHNQNDGMVGWNHGGVFFENTVINNSNYGIWLGGDNNNITGNLVKNNGLDGILIQWESRNNVLSSNTVNDNDRDGIYLHYNTNNSLLIGNTVNNNSRNGIYLNSAYDNVISENIVINNSRHGIVLDYCINNTINGNIAKGNFYDGIQVYNCDDIKIKDNIARNNDYDGITLWESENVTVLGNTAKGNYYNGIYLYCSNNSIVSENTVEDTFYDGIFLYNSNDNTIKNNAINNNSCGIWLYNYCNYNFLMGNTIKNNDLDGIRLEIDCDYNNITGNFICENSKIGINISSDCENNLMFYNYFFNNILNNARDNGQNYWDNGTIGNYWDDYTGIDADYNGIGDTPYTVPGVGTNKDNNPIMIYEVLFVEQPNDLIYEVGAEGNTIKWFILNPSTSSLSFNIFRDGTSIKTGQIFPLIINEISINIDGLKMGTFGFTIEIDYGNYGTFTNGLWVTVINTNPVFNSIPTDLSYEVGDTGNTLSWTFSDISTNNSTYTIYRDGVPIIIDNSCISGIPIICSVDGLDIGSYGYTIEINDGYDGIVLDSIWVTVINTNPVLTLTPSDFSYEVGETGNNISWIFSDVSTNNPTYTITRNGVPIIIDNPCVSGGVIEISVDGLDVGSYGYTIEVDDGYGETVLDSVWVTVNSSSTLIIIQHLHIEIVDQSFTTEEFNIIFSVYNESGQGIDFATIQLWWNGSDASPDIENRGNGLYFISLEPITVAPGDDPILLNLIISANGYQNKLFETYLAVDPDALEKEIGPGPEGDPLVITIIVISSVAGGIGIAGVIVIFLRRRKLAS